MSDDGHAILERYLSLEVRPGVQKLGRGEGGGGGLVTCGCKAMARDRVWERDVPRSVEIWILPHYLVYPELAVC